MLIAWALCLSRLLVRSYVLLTLLQTLYAYFIEGDIVFVGKRKTFDKRVRLLPSPVNSSPPPNSAPLPTHPIRHLPSAVCRPPSDSD